MAWFGESDPVGQTQCPSHVGVQPAVNQCSADSIDAHNYGAFLQRLELLGACCLPDSPDP